jgi:AcrR family transcriptional regulator
VRRAPSTTAAPRSDSNRAEITADPDVKLNAIAQRAGVGQATLYRHFPTRADLLAEVYRADVDALVETADTLLADHDPLTALHRWFDRVAEYAAVKRGVFAALEVSTGKDLAAHSHGPIGDAVTRLLDAGRAAGTIRPDVDARDVIILIGYLSRLEPAEFDDRARRLLGVVLDGLRAPGRQRRVQPVPAGDRGEARRHTWLRGIDRRQLWANTRSSPS